MASKRSEISMRGGRGVRREEVGKKERKGEGKERREGKDG